jgi:hypothetical protein
MRLVQPATTHRDVAPLPRVHELLDHRLRSTLEILSRHSLRQTADVELPHATRVGEEHDVVDSAACDTTFKRTGFLLG